MNDASTAWRTCSQAGPPRVADLRRQPGRPFTVVIEDYAGGKQPTTPMFGFTPQVWPTRRPADRSLFYRRSIIPAQLATPG